MIRSSGNQQIKNIIRLKKSGKARREQGVFLVEGIRMFREIPETLLKKAFITEEWVSDLPSHWQEGNDYEIVTDSVFRDCSDTLTPQGILAVVKQQEYRREDLLGENPCILVLENLQDPGNLGTIIRTAEGAGVTGIMLSKDTVDIYNSKVVRATMGSVFRMPFLYEEDLIAGVNWLKDRGICCYAAHLNGSSFYDQNYQHPCCFFIGNEGNGLTDNLAQLADVRIRIPMAGQVESLNAATAATVLMYEAMRQRLN